MIQYITFKEEKYPVRIGYKALKEFKKEVGTDFTQMSTQEGGIELEHYEPLLFGALLAGASVDEIECKFKREQMEDVLDECMMEFISFIPLFFPDQEEGEGKTKPNRQQRRAKTPKGGVKQES